MNVILRELNKENDTFELVVDFVENTTVITRDFRYSTTSKEDVLRDIRNKAKQILDTFSVMQQLENNISVTYYYNEALDKLERV